VPTVALGGCDSRAGFPAVDQMSRSTPPLGMPSAAVRLVRDRPLARQRRLFRASQISRILGRDR